MPKKTRTRIDPLQCSPIYAQIVAQLKVAGATTSTIPFERLNDAITFKMNLNSYCLAASRRIEEFDTWNQNHPEVPPEDNPLRRLIGEAKVKELEAATFLRNNYLIRHLASDSKSPILEIIPRSESREESILEQALAGLLHQSPTTTPVTTPAEDVTDYDIPTSLTDIATLTPSQLAHLKANYMGFLSEELQQAVTKAVAITQAL